MIDSSVARRYARALLSLGLDEGRFEQYGEELESVVQAMKQSPELGFLLVNPGYTQQQRYDFDYHQCMYAKGHHIPMAANRYAPRAGYQRQAAPPPPPPPPPAGTPPPPPPPAKPS